MRSWDNHAAFAAIEAAGTGVSIGASYLFHHLRPSQTGTLDLDGAFRIGDVGRGAQLLPENGTSKDHSVARGPQSGNATSFTPSKSTG